MKMHLMFKYCKYSENPKQDPTLKVRHNAQHWNETQGILFQTFKQPQKMLCYISHYFIVSNNLLDFSTP